MPLKRLDPEVFSYKPVCKEDMGEAPVSKVKLKSGPTGIVGRPPESIEYPTTTAERAVYRTKAGKKLTPYQWAVYDFTLCIPSGKVTTYKHVSHVVGGSPRSAGTALRNNPFSPYVPCHRVIASNMFVGGFFGEWGENHRTGSQYNKKIDVLAREGVIFDRRGRLVDSSCVLAFGTA